MGPCGPVRTSTIGPCARVRISTRWAVRARPDLDAAPDPRHTYRMHSAFIIVIWVVSLLALVIAFGALIAGRKTWEDYGKGQFVMDRDADPGQGERDEEIRQLLEARNARRERRGEAPVDVDEELARLTAPAVDPALREEIRQLVVARNHRRVRAGKPPLDVEAEIEREITALGGL